jgi:hypothetical protein
VSQGDTQFAFFDFAVLAEGFAEVDRDVGFAVGGGPGGAGDIHVHNIRQNNPVININLGDLWNLYMSTYFRPKSI